MTDQRVLLLTYIEIFRPRKTSISPVKILPNFFFTFFTFTTQCNFLVWTLKYFQKKLNLFFAM